MNTIAEPSTENHVQVVHVWLCLRTLAMGDTGTLGDRSLTADFRGQVAHFRQFFQLDETCLGIWCCLRAISLNYTKNLRTAPWRAKVTPPSCRRFCRILGELGLRGRERLGLGQHLLAGTSAAREAAAGGPRGWARPPSPAWLWTRSGRAPNPI